MSIPSIKHLVVYDRCPTCSAQIKEVSINNLHSNGQWHEMLRFACGFVVRWEPNYQKSRIGELCGTTKPPIVVGKRYIDHGEERDVYATVLTVSRVRDCYDAKDVVLQYGPGDVRIVSEWQFYSTSYRKINAHWRFEPA
jgi:hypothetical protein